MGKSGSESHVFPRGFTLSAEHMVATVEGNHLQVMLPTSNFCRRKLSQFGGECYEAFIPIAGGEDTRLEGLVGFFIDECTNLHPTACCKCEQVARFDDCCHTKLQEVNLLGFTGGGTSPMKWGWGECLYIISPSRQSTKNPKNFQKKFKKCSAISTKLPSLSGEFRKIFKKKIKNF